MTSQQHISKTIDILNAYAKRCTKLTANQPKQLKDIIEQLQQNIDQQFTFSEKQWTLFNGVMNLIARNSANMMLQIIQQTTFLLQSISAQPTEIAQNIRFEQHLKGETPHRATVLGFNEQDTMEQKMRQIYNTIYVQRRDQMINFKYIELKVDNVQDLIKHQLKGTYESYDEFLIDVQSAIDRVQTQKDFVEKAQCKAKNEEAKLLIRETLMNKKLKLNQNRIASEWQDVVLLSQCKDLCATSAEIPLTPCDEWLYINTLAQHHDVLLPQNTKANNHPYKPHQQVRNMILNDIILNHQQSSTNNKIQHTFVIFDENDHKKTITSELPFNLIGQIEELKPFARNLIKQASQIPEDDEDIYFDTDITSKGVVKYNLRRSNRSISRYVITLPLAQ